MELKNITRYYPENIPYGNNVQYFQSEDGKDFYESLSLFTKKYKLCIHPDTGVIHSVSEDVSALYPAGFSVVEVDELPESMNINGGWQFVDGVVSAVPVNWNAAAENQRVSLLSSANDTIEDWRTELKLDMISEENKIRLTAWMTYIAELKNMTLADVKSKEQYDALAWPVKPE
ncbi:tail fiber assembly protein [Escherichia coli]|uniref:Phage tail protein n=1 Tax=Escherichia coli TaxID=562 RepID=A0A6L6ZT50_ECOLX|nr:tail fiber assembly protein [Escherichia coli]EKK3248829.1 tail fiber assembly protein [Escherichia coli]MBB7084298.1 tail fiber assembly protein [Escherichia coli]MWL35779.1 phage tail protein [Escherichia coli]MWL44983.1 phage tail protein [Escherichia coli]MWM27604.1 phage tail protein [Escherichia coli]